MRVSVSYARANKRPWPRTVEGAAALAIATNAIAQENEVAALFAPVVADGAADVVVLIGDRLSALVVRDRATRAKEDGSTIILLRPAVRVEHGLAALAFAEA